MVSVALGDKGGGALVPKHKTLVAGGIPGAGGGDGLREKALEAVGERDVDGALVENGVD